MDFEKSLNYAVEELTKGSNFQIKVVSYDEANFGNAEVSLLSSQNLKIRFLLDKGERWCEIGRSNDEWFPLKDVLDVLGFNFSPNTYQTRNQMIYFGLSNNWFLEEMH